MTSLLRAGRWPSLSAFLRDWRVMFPCQKACRALRWPVIFLTIFVGVYAPTYYYLTMPTTKLAAIREVDGVVAHGGSLDLIFDLTRYRVCNGGRADRWVWQWSGLTDKFGRQMRRYVSLPERTNPPPTKFAEEDVYILSLPMPANVTPGHWFYWSRQHDGCWPLPFFQPPDRESVNVPFDVVDGPAPGVPPSLEMLLPQTLTPR